MVSSNGFSITISVPTGKRDDLLIIEKAGWSGKGYFFHRESVESVRKQSLIADPGVYILWGNSEDNPLPPAYIGESENPGERFRDHVGPKGKDFWEWTAVFTGELNKAHVQYLEASLVELAEGSKRCDRGDANTPQKPNLGIADEIHAQTFLSNMLLCLPILGVNFFEHPEVPSHEGLVGSQSIGSTDTDKEVPISHIELRLAGTYGVDARGFHGSEFVVLEGSKASKTEHAGLADSKSYYVRDWRTKLLELGVLHDNGETLEFTQNYGFGSPSLAAAVCLARSANGKVEWKDVNGRTLAEIESLQS